MKTAFRLLVAAAISAVLVPASFAGHTHSPTPATWTLNVAESNFDGGPSMKSDEMTILTDTEKWLKFTDVSIDADGKTWTISWSGPQTGKMMPLEGMPGAKAGFTTANDSAHWEMPDGSTTDTLLTMAADKKKVTIISLTKTKEGKEFHQTLVYDRTK